MVKNYDICVIGGGIIGLTICHSILERFPRKKICILEKEHECGLHQTKNNSGVIHCGLSYKPKSLKAQFTSRGANLLRKFADDNKIKYENCGKIVIDPNDNKEAIDRVYELAQANKLPGVQRLYENDIKEFEPYCEKKHALAVPGEGIISFSEVAKKVREKCETRNSTVFNNAEALSIRQELEHSIVRTKQFSVQARNIINCAGLFSDRIFKTEKVKSLVKIVPFRGEYFALTPESCHKVRGLIYPTPNLKYPFLGVHFTKTIDGTILAGPNAVLALKREGYHKCSMSIKDTLDTFSDLRLVKFLTKNMSMCAKELITSISKTIFVRELQKLIPAIEKKDLKTCFSGVRAQAMDNMGNLLNDFEVKVVGNNLHVLNSPSPAATSSFAIAEYIVTKYQTLINE